MDINHLGYTSFFFWLERRCGVIYCVMVFPSSLWGTKRVLVIDHVMLYVLLDKTCCVAVVICPNIITNSDGSLATKVYRKPTHTDHYLQFDSHHPLIHKLGVFRTLSHRAEQVISDPTTP